MKRARHGAIACGAYVLVAQTIFWQPIAHEIVLFVQMLLIILLAVVLGSIAVSLLPAAARLAQQLWLYPSRRRAAARWAREQRIAELEAAGGHSVVWKGSCPSCHASLVMGAQYCSACGCTVAGDERAGVLVCQLCHETNPASGRFCSRCGQRLQRPAP